MDEIAQIILPTYKASKYTSSEGIECWEFKCVQSGGTMGVFRVTEPNEDLKKVIECYAGLFGAHENREIWDDWAHKQLGLSYSDIRKAIQEYELKKKGRVQVLKFTVPENEDFAIGELLVKPFVSDWGNALFNVFAYEDDLNSEGHKCSSICANDLVYEIWYHNPYDYDGSPIEYVVTAYKVSNEYRENLNHSYVY